MASKQSIISSFIGSAPPGELSNVIADVQVLAGKDQVQAVESAFQKYHEEQYTTFKLPGSSELALVSAHNSIEDSRYVDTASQTSFQVDHITSQAKNTQSHPIESKHSDLIKSLQKSFQAASSEHFPSYTISISSAENDAAVAVLLVANKYSPQNFWNGRWRSTYIVRPSGGVTGSIKVDVHYYEDGNVRMNTKKEVSFESSSSGDQIVREIAKAENKFQEDLNRAFITLAEGSFKGLRRQLPVTRQRVEWEKIGGYRLGQDIGGGRAS